MGKHIPSIGLRPVTFKTFILGRPTSTRTYLRTVYRTVKGEFRIQFEDKRVPVKQDGNGEFVFEQHFNAVDARAEETVDDHA